MVLAFNGLVFPSTEQRYRREISYLLYKLTRWFLALCEIVRLRLSFELPVTYSDRISGLSQPVSCCAMSILSCLYWYAWYTYTCVTFHCFLYVFMSRNLLYLCITLLFSKLPSVSPCENENRKGKSLENENMSHSILRNWVKLYFGKLSDRSLIKDGFYIKLERLNVRMVATILYPTLLPSMSARNWMPPFQVSLLPDCSFWLSSSSTIKTFHLLTGLSEEKHDFFTLISSTAIT